MAVLRFTFTKTFQQNFTFTRPDQKVSGLTLWKSCPCTTVPRGHNYILPRPVTAWCLHGDREGKVSFLVWPQPANELPTATKSLTNKFGLWARFANRAVQRNAFSVKQAEWDLAELRTTAPVLTHRLLIKQTGCYDCEMFVPWLRTVPAEALQRAIFKHHSYFCECAVHIIRRHVTNSVTKTRNQRLAPFRNTRYVSHISIDMDRVQIACGDLIVYV